MFNRSPLQRFATMCAVLRPLLPVRLKQGHPRALRRRPHDHPLHRRRPCWLRPASPSQARAAAAQVAFTRFASRLGVSVGKRAPRRPVATLAAGSIDIDLAARATLRKAPPGSEPGMSVLAARTRWRSDPPLLRFDIPLQRLPAASRAALGRCRLPSRSRFGVG